MGVYLIKTERNPMRRALTLIATLAFAVSMAGTVDAAACKDAKGKFTKCPAPAAASASYTLDAKGNCHDAKGKMAKKAMCPGVASTTAAVAPASTSPKVSSTTTAMASGFGPICKKGKRCGNACISVKDTCHK
jgi:hypothetical protein